MNKYELLALAKQKLKDHHLDLKLADYLFRNLYSFDKENVTTDEWQLYNHILDKILSGIPYQYAVGKVNFYGLEFKVNNHVLIPRFETEELVYYTIQYISKYFNNKATLVDIGTGSGIIAITLKKNIPNLTVYATDISINALEIAKINANNLNVDINFLAGDMLAPIKDLKFDIIISNPPYLSFNQIIDDIVIKNEPHIALYGGNDGLKYYRQLFKEVKAILNERSLICLEISEEIVTGLKSLLEEYFKDTKYEFKKDMAGRTRMLFIFNNLD